MKITRFDIGYAAGVVMMGIRLGFETPFWITVIVGVVGYTIGSIIANRLFEE